MTVSAASVPPTLHDGDGITTGFATGFKFLDPTHLTVVQRSAAGFDVVQTLTTDFTVSGANEDAGGTVTFLVPPASGWKVVISLAVPASQDLELNDNDDFPAKSLERALDKLTMLLQQLSSSQALAVRFPLSDLGSDTLVAEVPARELRANRAFRWDANGNPSTVGNEVEALFYGRLASDPLTRPDGSARRLGDLYVNEGSGSLRGFDGASWAALTFIFPEASAIIFDPAGTDLVATRVQAAVAELWATKADFSEPEFENSVAVYYTGAGTPIFKLAHAGITGDTLLARGTGGTEGYIDHEVLTGEAQFGISPKPLDGTGAATMREFRRTNTTGVRSVKTYLGNDTNTVVAERRVRADGTGLDLVGIWNFLTTPKVNGVDIVGWLPVGRTVVGAPVAQVDFALPAGYDMFDLNLLDVRCSAAGYPALRFSTDGGSTYLAGASDYSYGGFLSGTPGSVDGALDTAHDRISLLRVTDLYVSGQPGLTGVARIFKSDRARVETSGLSMGLAAGARVFGQGFGTLASTTDTATNARFIWSTGNVASGTLILLGRKS